MQREAVRVQQPDGSFKVIFRDSPGTQKDQEKKVQEQVTEKPESKGKPRKGKKEIQDPRYFNPLNPDHIDIFGRDLLNRDLYFHLNNGEGVKGKMIGFGQYEVLVQIAGPGKKYIVMKQAISTVEVL